MNNMEIAISDVSSVEMAVDSIYPIVANLIIVMGVIVLIFGIVLSVYNCVRDKSRPSFPLKFIIGSVVVILSVGLFFVIPKLDMFSDQPMSLADYIVELLIVFCSLMFIRSLLRLYISKRKMKKGEQEDIAASDQDLKIIK